MIITYSGHGTWVEDSSGDEPDVGKVVTFYSYKGGTGRSMALANLACLLVSETKGDILMVDWDLEAPGLHHYFPISSNKSTAKSRGKGRSVEESDEGPGLIELMTALAVATPKRRPAFQTDLEARAEKTLNEIDIQAYIRKTRIPNLHLLKAGRFDASYPSRVNTFQWEALYLRSPELMRMLAERLANGYRYVLVDSRTGLTDISNICTSLMPELLVVVFTPNRQSLTGMEDMIRRATSYRRQSGDLRPLLVYPLPSRIDPEREQLRLLWRHGDKKQAIPGYQPLFEGLLKDVYRLDTCSLEMYCKEVFIPHSPDIAFGEEISVLNKGKGDRYSLERNYRAFFEWFGDSVSAWDDPEVARKYRELAALEAQVETTAMEQERNVEARIDYINLLKEVLKRYQALKGEDALSALAVQTRLASALWRQGDLAGARLLEEKVLAVHRRELGEEHPDTLTSMNNLTGTLRDQGDLAGARALQEKVLEGSRRMLGENHPDTLKALSQLLLIAQEAGDTKTVVALSQILAEGVEKSGRQDHIPRHRQHE